MADNTPETLLAATLDHLLEDANQRRVAAAKLLSIAMGQATRVFGEDLKLFSVGCTDTYNQDSVDINLSNVRRASELLARAIQHQADLWTLRRQYHASTKE